MLTYSLDSRNADVYAEKVKVGLQHCTRALPGCYHWPRSTFACLRLCAACTWPPTGAHHTALPCGHVTPAHARALVLNL